MIIETRSKVEKPFDQSMLRIKNIGIELEGFTERISSTNIVSINGGKFEDDAGFNLCELITEPQSSVNNAFRILREMLLYSSFYVHFTPFRPADFSENAGKWHDKSRYTCIREALNKESDCGYLVNNMTNLAALQVNFSGLFDPFGEDGAFLINMFNAIGPYFAHKVHQETRFGIGHLLFWQKFAREERLPKYGRWFRDAEDMINCFESTPKLIKHLGGDEYEILPDEKQSIYDPLDLGLNWQFLRFKRDKLGAYSESRLLPSMPIDLSEKYSLLTIKIVEAMLEWFHGVNKGKPVSSLAKSELACQVLNKQFPKFIPSRPLSEAEWRMCIKN